MPNGTVADMTPANSRASRKNGFCNVPRKGKEEEVGLGWDPVLGTRKVREGQDRSERTLALGGRLELRQAVRRGQRRDAPRERGYVAPAGGRTLARRSSVRSQR